MKMLYAKVGYKWLSKLEYGALILFLLTVASCTSGQQESGSSKLSPEAFQQAMEGNSMLVDVRSLDEVQSQYLAGTHNIDFRNPAFRDILNTLDKEKTYLVFCASGNRSGKTVELMQELGFETVYDLDGGMRAWNEQGLPVAISTPLPEEWKLESHGQSVAVVRGDESLAQLTCLKSVGDFCTAYEVSIVEQTVQSAEEVQSRTFYNRQEAIDWAVSRLNQMYPTAQ